MNISQKAQRGDLVLLTCLSSSTKLWGETTQKTEYRLAKVTSVTREGAVKAAERPQTAPWPWKLSSAGASCWIIQKGKLSVDADTLLRRMGQAVDFDSVERAREALKTWITVAYVENMPKAV